VRLEHRNTFNLMTLEARHALSTIRKMRFGLHAHMA